MEQYTKEHQQRLVKERSTLNRKTGCWQWSLFTAKLGYGQIRVCGKQWHAHRFAYQAFKQLIPKGMLVCHSCDNPSCVNPEHLWLGTHKQNTQDCINKGRFKANKCAQEYFDKHGMWALHSKGFDSTRKPRHRKLTDAQVLDIRASSEPLKALALKHNTSMANVSLIRRGKRKPLI